jgi:hypothetical protein
MPDEADQDLPAISAQDFEAIAGRSLSRVQPIAGERHSSQVGAPAVANLTGASDWSPKIRALS